MPIGTAERQLESILQPALRQLIPIRSFPRTVIQITLQISETPENVYVNSKLVQARLVCQYWSLHERKKKADILKNLALIPALLHTAVLSLLTAAIPLKEIATAVSLAIPSEENARIISDPDTREAEQASSLHVMAFTSSKELLLVESEGSFTESQWDAVLKAGEQLCCREDSKDLDQTMHDGELESASIKSFIRSVMETKTAGDLHWK